jgi:hypothetical protein
MGYCNGRFCCLYLVHSARQEPVKQLYLKTYQRRTYKRDVKIPNYFYFGTCSNLLLAKLEKQDSANPGMLVDFQCLDTCVY